jgi:hypothetical protein
VALQKQPVSINFSQGIDTKSDPYQVPIGKFLSLVNSVFTTAGRLTKRLGFANITALPNNQQTTLTTFNGNLTATGSDLYAFSADTNMWLNKGTIQPIQLNTLSLVRSSTSQQSPDTAVTANGLICLAYMDSGHSYYQISDSTTGQQIVNRVSLPSTAVNPRVFLLNNYFLVTYIATVTGTPTLQCIAIPIATPSLSQTITISANVNSLQAGYDGSVFNNELYIAWAGSASTIFIARVFNNLTVSSAISTASDTTVTLMSVVVDTISGIIWMSWWDSVTNNGFSKGFSTILTPIVPPVAIVTGVVISELTSLAQQVGTNSVLSIFYENVNNYTYTDTISDAIESDFISKLTVTAPSTGGSGTASATTVMLRSVGLASKAFINASTGAIYMLVAYGDTKQINPEDNSNQPSYFLVDSLGNVYMRLAYSNGGGYAASQVLPSVNLLNGQYLIPYQITDFLAAVNKQVNLPTGTPTNAIYTQTGISLAKISIDSVQYSSEIASSLHLTGGQLWQYDGVKPVEHGFQVWPENVIATTSGSGGLITAQTYYYSFTYEWTDNAGNLHRSAPSIPFPVVTSGSTSTNTIHVPTDRLTYKITPNPIRIVGYRWSTAQQEFFQFTSLTNPTLNDTTIDSVTFTDTLADSSILGNTLLYTTGGVIEDIAAPASIASALFKNRLFLIDAEDQNLLWYSKQVIENVPVEMSDLLTLFVAPTSGVQGSTGPMTALSAMDDKLIIFKKDAIYYLTGTGPDNTGAQNDFTDPIFITSSVGTSNPNSIVLIPNGVMFQSDKGIWLLGRDLGTTYIGAPVEGFNSQTVMSATSIPGTNQVRFVLSNNVTLMYDYFFEQWATHTNIEAISATLYQSVHTYLNALGMVYQETQNNYLDGSSPVLMSLTTSWINLAGLQGFERFYEGLLLGTYFSPFQLNVQLAYDYNAGIQQSIIVTPDNFVPNWGGEALWGSNGPWGGPGNVFSARIFPEKQKCESFQVTINELYDPSFGQLAGQGLTLSGLALVVGMKRGFRTQKASRSFG